MIEKLWRNSPPPLLIISPIFCHKNAKKMHLASGHNDVLVQLEVISVTSAGTTWVSPFFMRDLKKFATEESCISCELYFSDATSSILGIRVSVSGLY